MSDNTINDGGSAFPYTEQNFDGTPYCAHLGMTLRDYFAAAALQGLVGEMMKSAADNRTTPHIAKIWLADGCYAVADAMIEARKQPTK
jgi:hypothetical protein